MASQAAVQPCSQDLPRFDHGLPRVLRLLRRARVPARHAGDVGSAAGQAARPAHVGRSAGAEPEQLPGAVGAGSGLGESTSGRCSTRPRSPPRTAIRAFMPARRSWPRRRDREARCALPRRLARAVFGTIKRDFPPRPHRLRAYGPREACHGAWPERSRRHHQTGPRQRPHRLRVKGIAKEACHGAWPERSSARSNGASPAAAPASR